MNNKVIDKNNDIVFYKGDNGETNIELLKHTASDGKTYNIEFYNLDAINSAKQTSLYNNWAYGGRVDL